MNAKESILDKILQSKQINQAIQFKPDELADEFLKHLSTKEKEILAKRFGLNGHEPHTLEHIGIKHEITRERIRQIQNAAIKKIKELDSLQSKLEFINTTIVRQLQEYGGIMEETHFLDELLSYSNKSHATRRAAQFIVSQLLDQKIDRIKNSDLLLPGWKLKTLSIETAHGVVDLLHTIIAQKNALLETSELLEAFRNHEFFNQKKFDLLPLGYNEEGSDSEGQIIDRILVSYLNISKKINKNILEKWGLTSWPTILPKRMGDKIYLVLMKKGKPLHYKEISEAINEVQFDTKVAYPATIHNELILDDRYILVGRGIYALQEWGYKSGTVSDVIEDILKNSSKPLLKKEILDEVLKRRIVKKSTIYLALTNKDKFKKVEDHYSLINVRE